MLGLCKASLPLLTNLDKLCMRLVTLRRQTAALPAQVVDLHLILSQQVFQIGQAGIQCA